MSDLAVLVPALQRAVAVPGRFEDVFPETSEDDLLATLLDGFAEAQLDGWLTTYTATDDGVVDPDLERAQEALVVLYASTRILVSEIRARRTHVRYEASGAVFEEDQSAQMLVQLLKDLQARKQELLKIATRVSTTSAFWMADAYMVRNTATDWR